MGKIDICWRACAVNLMLVALSFFEQGCNKSADEIKVYRLVKAALDSTPPAEPAMPTNVSSPGAVLSAKPQIKWDVPAGWMPAAATAMRYASFTVGEGGDKIDISVVTFPGTGGSDLDNINRWRQQLALPPITESTDVGSITPANATFSTIDIAGTNGRTLAAWTRRDGRAWFVKLTGPASAVDREKANFTNFVQSIRF